MITTYKRPSARPTEHDLLTDAITQLRNAERAMARLTGIVEEIPWADWKQLQDALPIDFTRFMLTAEANTLQRLLSAKE